jgi:hypothetical protein
LPFAGGVSKDGGEWRRGQARGAMWPQMKAAPATVTGSGGDGGGDGIDDSGSDGGGDGPPMRAAMEAAMETAMEAVMEEAL